MSALKLQPGERVDLTIRGARVEAVETDTNAVTIRYPIGGQGNSLHDATLMLGGAVTVTRVAPAEWPPQPGDVWGNEHGMTLFAYSANGFKEYVELRSARGDLFEDPATALELVGPLALVYRDGWTPAPAADVDQADEPEQVDERAASAALLRHIADGIDAGLPVPWTVSDHFDLYLYAPGLGAGPDTAAVDAWVAHIDPAGQATSREHSYDAKLVWRGACEVKVWTPAPRPTTPDLTPSPEEVAGPVAAGPATVPDFELGPVPHERCPHPGKRHQRHTVTDEQGTFDCPGLQSTLTDEQIDGAVVALAEAVDANPELLDDAEIEAADEREAKRTGGDFALRYLGPVETDAAALDQLGVAVTGADEVAVGGYWCAVNGIRCDGETDPCHLCPTAADPIPADETPGGEPA